jgi:hypothetical protein
VACQSQHNVCNCRGRSSGAPNRTTPQSSPHLYGLLIKRPDPYAEGRIGPLAISNGREVDLIKAAKAGDKAAQQQADTKWHQNATQIADFLSKANPNWPRATLVDLMNKHLSTTTDEVVARLGKKWDDDVRAFDAVYDHILHMSDALSEGIVKQFPEKFGAGVTSTTGKR